ncbi:hypothetical protein Dimus_016080 [Dionaea muscipula]
MARWAPRRGKDEMISLFVEDLPESMGREEMFKIFTKFGVVRDVYIPRKRRIGGSMDYGRRGQKMKEKWRHDPTVGSHQGHDISGSKTRPTLGKSQTFRWVQKKNNTGSYANAVKTGTGSSTMLPSVKGMNFGNGWLHRSAVASLSDYRTSEYLIESYMRDGQGITKGSNQEIDNRGSFNSRLWRLNMGRRKIKVGNLMIAFILVGIADPFIDIPPPESGTSFDAVEKPTGLDEREVLGNELMVLPHGIRGGRGRILWLGIPAPREEASQYSKLRPGSTGFREFDK